MNYKIFSLIHYENNKLIYDYEKYNIKYILDNIKDTICLVLDDNIYSPVSFVSNKKYFRYFVNEKYNLEKTSYVCWQQDNNNNFTLINNNILFELLSNLSSQTKYIKLNEHSTREEREKEFKYYCSYCNFGTFSVDLFNKHNLTEKHKNFILQIKK